MCGNKRHKSEGSLIVFDFRPTWSTQGEDGLKLGDYRTWPEEPKLRGDSMSKANKQTEGNQSPPKKRV